MYGPSTHEQMQTGTGETLRGILRDKGPKLTETLQRNISKVKRIAAVDAGSIALGAVTAIGGAVVDRFLTLVSREVNEPALELRFQDRTEPYCWTEPVTEPVEQAFLDHKGLAYFVRMEVFNGGRGEATRCKGEVTRVMNLRNSKAIGRVVPFKLQWVSGLETSKSTRVSIGRKASAFLGLVLVVEGPKPGEWPKDKGGPNKAGFMLDLDRLAPNFGGKRRGYTGGHYAIEFKVSGKGFDAIEQTLEVTQKIGAPFEESLGCQLHPGTIESNLLKLTSSSV